MATAWPGRFAAPRPELGVGNPPPDPPWDPQGPTETARPLQLPTVAARLRKKPGPISDVVAARTLQNSALRQVWSRLFSWRDWTSYVYLALAVGLFLGLPALAFRMMGERQQVVKARALAEAISRTDLDQQDVLRLAEQGPVKAWTPVTPEKIAKIDTAAVPGMIYTTDRQIFDLRQAEVRQPAGAKPSDYTLSISRRIRVHKTNDYQPDGPFALPITVLAVNCDVRCLNTNLNPRLRRLDKNLSIGSRTGSEWELTLDLSTAPLYQPINVQLEILSWDPLPGDFWQHPHVDLSTALPVEELTLWVLMPEKRPYDRFDVVETTQSGKSHEVIPAEGVPSARGSILHWRLFQPDVRAVYRCQWNNGEE